MLSPSSTADTPSTLAHSRQLFHIVATVLLAISFGAFAYSFFLNWLHTGHITILLFALQEAITVLLVITRRHTTKATQALPDWIVATIGTWAPMFLRPASELTVLAPVGAVLQAVGMTITIGAFLSLGRSFGVVAANRGVQTHGLYRFVRHPIYGSYMIGYLGFFISGTTLWNTLLLVAVVLSHYLRARAEERILLQDSSYQAYAAQVRYRFLPYLF